MCKHSAKTFGPIIKHLNSEHKFGAVFTPPIPHSPRIVHHTPELTCPKVGDQSPKQKRQETAGAASPELRLHLSEDEDDFDLGADLHDAQTTAYCGPNQVWSVSSLKDNYQVLRKTWIKSRQFPRPSNRRVLLAEQFKNKHSVALSKNSVSWEVKEDSGQM